MHRKITRTGPATLTMALPAKWVQKNNLEPGQELKLDEIENQLIVSVQSRTDNSKEIKRIAYDEVLIKDMLEKVYKENISQIMIHSATNIPKSIKEIIAKFPGLKIMEEEKNKIILNQTLEPILSNPSAILRRIYLLLKQGIEFNPPKFEDLEELLFLNSLQNKDSKENETIKSIFETLDSIKKPIFDEMNAYIQTIFSLIYEQKYSFSKSKAIQIKKLFEDKDSLFETYAKKERTLILAKIYHSVSLLETLNKIIIKNQSLETLQSTENTSKKDFIVGVCLKNNSNKFWKEYVQGSMEESQKEFKNIEFIYKAPFTYPDIKAQEKIIDEFIEIGVDLIILAPLHPTKLEKHIKKIEKARIKLIVIDTEVESTVKNIYIGWNNYKGGELTANFLQKKLNSKSKCEILVVEGEKEGNFHERVIGFTDTIKKHKVHIISANFQQSIAYKKTLELLKKKKVDAIYATSDNMALGILQALEELKLKILVCGFDATEEVIELIKKKKIICTIDDKPKVLGSLAIDVANKLLKNKQVSNKIVYEVELVS